MKVTLEHPKIYSSSTLRAALEVWKSAKKKIVFTNGCFDLLHPGHVDLLARAKALGDVLVLGLNSDDSVRRQNKGPERPLNSFAARAFVLAHLESVDAVIEFTEDTPLELIKKVLPAVLVKGGDWTPENIVGKDIVEEQGGIVCSLPLLAGYSTTTIVQRVREKRGCS